MDGMATHKRKDPLGKWQARAVGATPWIIAGFVILTALGLAAYAAAASYDTVAGQAVAHGVSLPRLNPFGIDGGLFGIIVFDIGLTVVGRPILWLRMAARLFAVGTVMANASAGWPDPVGVGLRIAAPALFVLIVEAGRHVLLRRDEDAASARKRKREQRIPAARWMLAPWPTFVMWRRMKLWRITDYRTALDMELSRRRAIVKLEMKYDDGWRDAAPADLVWMLRNGVKMADALAMVAELTKPAGPDLAPNKGSGSAPKRITKRTAKPAPKRTTVSPRSEAVSSPPETQVPKDVDTQAEALLILAEEPDISGSELGVRLGKTKRYGQILKNKLVVTSAGPEGGTS